MNSGCELEYNFLDVDAFKSLAGLINQLFVW